jgi:hypothetical protein
MEPFVRFFIVAMYHYYTKGLLQRIRFAAFVFVLCLFSIIFSGTMFLSFASGITVHHSDGTPCHDTGTDKTCGGGGCDLSCVSHFSHVFNTAQGASVVFFDCIVEEKNETGCADNIQDGFLPSVFRPPSLIFS